jgi:thiol:disulfide interchange protein DsbA
MNLKRLLMLAPLPAAVLAVALMNAHGQAQPAGTAQPLAARPERIEQAAAPAQPTSGRRVLAQAQPKQTAGNEFELGKNYERLSPAQPTSSSPDKVEVAEIFWYGCPHCYDFDPYVEKWLTEKPDYINFVRIPAVWNPLLEIHARAFYTAQTLGKEQEMHQAFFREIHVNGDRLDTEAKLQAFFGRFGVSAEDFEKAFDSFTVHTKLQRAEELARRYRVTAVPSMVVNGKYVTNGSMAGSYDKLMELVDYLAAMEKDEQG